MSSFAERKRTIRRVPGKWVALAAYVLAVLVSRWVTSEDRQPRPELARAIEVTRLSPAGTDGMLPVVVVPSLPDHGERKWALADDILKFGGVREVHAARWPTGRHRSRPSMAHDAFAADLLSELEARFGRGRFHLVGEGMGGMVAAANC